MIRLTNMLKSGKELKVFSVKDTQLQKFCREAKKYGVLYCVLKDKKDKDGCTDLFVRAEDASKINRIFDRFGIAVPEMATSKTEIVKAKETLTENPVPDRHTTEKDKDEAFLDELLKPAPNKEKTEAENPTMAPTVKSPLLEPTSKPHEKTDRGISDTKTEDRKSVRETMKEIREERRSKDTEGTTRDVPTKGMEHSPKPKKKDKER